MKRNLILILTLVIAFAARWYKIDNPVADWHSWRQADTASVSQYYLQHGINLFVPKYNDISRIASGVPNPNGYRMVEFPIYNAIHTTLAKSLPFWNLDKWGRVLSATLSLVSIVFLYLILDYFSGAWVAHLGALLMAILPFNIYYSRVILPEPLMLAYLLPAFYYGLLAIKKPIKTNFLLSSVLLSLSLLVKPYAIFFVIPLLFEALQKYGKKLLTNKHFYLYLFIVAAPLIAWRLWIKQFPEGIPASDWLYNVDGLRFRPAWFRWLFDERLSKLILGSWGVVLLAAGLLIRPTKKENWAYHLWFLGILIYFSVFAGGNVRHDYYQAIITPFLIAILSRGFVSMFTPNKLFVWPVAPILAVFSMSMMLFISWYAIRGYYQINNPVIVEAGQEADRILPKYAVVIAPYNADTAFLYQTRRRGFPLVTTDIEAMIKDGAQYYVSVNYDKFTKELMTKPWHKILEQNDKFVIIELHIP